MRGEIKKRLERGRRAGRVKCCTSLLISLRKMIEGIGRGGGRELERRVSGWRLVEEGWYAVALGKQAGE